MKPERFAHITDTELLRLYLESRDGEWLGVLLQRYTLLLLGVCMKYLKNEEEAKDAVQQIFLKVLTDIHKYEVTFFKSWLYMVAKNYCLMKLRGQTFTLQELTEKAVPAEEEKKPWQETEKRYALLEKAIEQLNPEQRQCVLLFYLHKNSYSQIAEKTGYSLLQVKSYIQNGKRNLKLLMEGTTRRPQQP